MLALCFGALLDARGLRRSAELEPPGTARSISLALTRPLLAVSHTLYLDRPRQELKAALGRSSDDRVDTTIALPPAQTRPRPRHRSTSVARRAGGGAVPATPRVARRPAFGPDRPLRVWVAGDSLAAVPGESLERAAGEHGPVDVVSVESRLGTGLGRPDVYNWYTRLPAAIAELRPRVAVLSFGADDAHSYMTGLPSGTVIGPLGSASWDAEYRRRVDGVIRELESAGVYVVWLGLPIIRGPTQNRSFRTVDRLLRAVVALHPQDAAFIDTYRMFASSHGHYTDYLRDRHGRLVLMRAADGVHYQPAAGDLIARTVLARLGKVFDLTGRKPARLARR